MCAVALCSGLAAPASAAGADPVLGQYPLCEASAAVVVHCPGGGDCLAVADNERDHHLFLFRLAEGAIDFKERIRLIDAESNEIIRIGDLEALLPLDESTVVAFGSHARTAGCRTKKRRQRAAVVTIHGGSAPTAMIAPLDLSCAAKVRDRRVLSICTRLRDVAQTADDIASARKGSGRDKEKAREQCAQLAPLNIEGAAKIANAYWLGLRAPLMPEDSASPQHAVMLRLALPEAATVEGAALLDLGGLGIRALSYSAGWVFGIAGPATRVKGEFRLFRFSADQSDGATPINVEFISELPDSAEGLVIHGDAAV